MYTLNDKQKVLKLFQAGNSIRQISFLTLIPKSTVADWIKEGQFIDGTRASEPFPDESDAPSGHPEKSTVPDEPDRFQENDYGNSVQTDQKIPVDGSSPSIPPLKRSIDYHQQDIIQRQNLTPKSFPGGNQIQVKTQSEPGINIPSQTKEDLSHDQLLKEKVKKIRLQEKNFVDSLKTLTRYYSRKKNWTTSELLDLQDRVLNLKRKMKNFYTLNSQITWSKTSLKSLLELAGDIEETIYNIDVDEEPFELVMNRKMIRLFRRIKEL